MGSKVAGKILFESTENVAYCNWADPPSIFLRAVRLAEKNRIRTKSLICQLRKVLKRVLRNLAKDQTISSFCCLDGDTILEVDWSETINTALAAARERTNCFSNILRGCCH